MFKASAFAAGYILLCFLDIADREQFNGQPVLTFDIKGRAVNLKLSLTSLRCCTAKTFTVYSVYCFGCWSSRVDSLCPETAPLLNPTLASTSTSPIPLLTMQGPTSAPPPVLLATRVERSSLVSTVRWDIIAPQYILVSNYFLCKDARSQQGYPIVFLFYFKAIPKIMGVSGHDNIVETAAEVGTEVVLPCEVQGHPSPSITWSRNGQPIPPVTAG